ncbi:O-antigen ligase family protein [Tundrisphaera sp. TA3]|uniref:O-antigen ligase family protein n=1 Tax=Tundrisphaera sp. TA3 TaxID=3435775 RepID=UPI003EB6CBDA
MLTLRLKLLLGLDRLIALALAAALVGAALAFGGAVWWARPPIAAITLALVLAWVARSAMAGSWRMLKSPLAGLGALALALALVQLLPLPVSIARRVSPRSVAANTIGTIPDKALADDPSAVLPAPFLARVPLTLDRPATLRWLAGGMACLAMFWVASHFCDRLGHARVVWGSVVAVFFVNTVLSVVQVANLSDGLYGFIVPGAGPIWAPSLADAAAAPASTVLRPLADARPATESDRARPAIAAARLKPQFQLGTLMGGPGGFLALGSLALPLALGMTLHLMSPRGSRGGLLTRLRAEGQGSQLVVLAALVLAGATLIGLVAGPSLAPCFAIAVLAVGLPGTWSAGLRWTGLLATLALVGAIGAGVALGGMLPPSSNGEGSPRIEWAGARRIWAEAIPIARDFPLVGTGLGSFAAVEPFYKASDEASNTAMSSVAQWAVETGGAGVALLGLAGLWCLVRLPGAIRRVGTADRALAFGLLGSLGGFALFSAVHWTVQLPAVALAASAVAGTANRWLAGGTDLFVDRG